MRSEFERAIEEHQTAFDLNLPEVTVNRLGDYYDLVQAHNPLLHLVAPCSAESLRSPHPRSLTLLEFTADQSLPMSQRGGLRDPFLTFART